MTKTDYDPHVSDCMTIADCRNHYFFGKFLRPREFEIEQYYFLSRHRLQNRLFHGWGVVCGLDVIGPDHEKWDEYLEALKRCGTWDPCELPLVIVTPGIALDPCGRELILKQPKAVPVFKEWLPDTSQQPDPTQQQGYQAPVQQQPALSKCKPRLLYLYYHEKLFDETASLCPKPADQTQYSFICECPEAGSDDLAEVEQNHPNCWHDPCEPWPEERVCLEADKSCPKPYVPLAVITPDPNKPILHGMPFPILPPDTSGRRTTSGPKLTTVQGTNWTHDDVFDLYHHEGELEVNFTRDISDHIKPELLNHAITVYYRKRERVGKIEAKYEDTYILIKDPRRDPNTPSRITFGIPDNVFNDLPGATVYICIDCDFILDCNGVPVDGNHQAILTGDDPHNRKLDWRFGNGTRGGVFKSWFMV